MRLLVATLGSLGDLHPFLAVARAAQEQGHEVLFLSQEAHRKEVEAEGVAFEPILSAHDHQRALAHPLLWHPLHGFGVLWRHVAVPAIEPTMSALQRWCQGSDQATQVLASPLVVGARLALELGWNLRLTSGHTAPSGLRSTRHPMFVAGRMVPRWCPDAVRGWLWRELDRRKLQPMALPGLNLLRQRLGLAPLQEPVFQAWIHSPQANVALFPANFGPMPDDWPLPQPPLFAGFPLYRQGTPRAADAELQAWLRSASQTPLLLAYPGSAPTAAAARIRALAAEAAAKGFRVLELSAGTDHVAGLHAKRQRVDLAACLPSVKLVLHHGGIGITAESLATARRQCVLPSAYDQFDNAWRLATCSPASGRLTDPSELWTAISAESAVPQPRSWTHSEPGHPNSAVQQVLAHLKE